MLALEGYLLYRAVALCCSYNELSWRPGMDRPVAELYAYIGLIVINVMCLPFFVVFSLFQVQIAEIELDFNGTCLFGSGASILGIRGSRPQILDWGVVGVAGGCGRV